jgi:exodeoxyribonuclease-3
MASSTPESSSEPIRFLTLNISGPSVARAELLAAFLDEMDADVVVLTETRDNEGTRCLLNWCRDSGYLVNGALPSSRGERGVIVIRRVGPDSSPTAVEVDLPHRLVIDNLTDDASVRLMAAYVPSRDASAQKIERKRTFLDQMATTLRNIAEQDRIVLMGDLNIVGRSHIPKYSAFKNWEYDALDSIVDAGLRDVFAEMNPGVQAYSWVGRTGHGYRYDYVFVSPDLLNVIDSCEYLQRPREQGITDHAAVLLTLRQTTSAFCFSPYEASGVLTQ